LEELRKTMHDLRIARIPAKIWTEHLGERTGIL
jgi:hypothetical protein